MSPLWERTCSRWRWLSLQTCCLTHRYREQARSHRRRGGEPLGYHLVIRDLHLLNAQLNWAADAPAVPSAGFAGSGLR
ncbi:hypothetical protein FHJ31_08360 [Pseudomonas sp. Fig-3]|nr:hypothetical protein FHJ31_08360 [Pseudomonas sp. Fig-3]